MSGDVVSRVRCTHCRSGNAVRIGPDEPVRDELARRRCPGCGRAGGLRLERPLTVPTWREPTRIGPHDAPPDDPDEAEDVEIRRDMRAARRAR